MNPPPSAQLWQIATDYLLPRCLHVVTELGVADHLGETPATAEALAMATGVSADPLDRMLRLLAAVGVFEARGSLWAHTELSRLMRSDHPQSMRPYIRMMGGRMFWAAAGELKHAAHTGKAAVEKLAAGGIWSYLRDHPDEASIFDAAMTARSNAEIAALIPAFDFTRYNIIADVGGGRGNMLSAVLAATPNAKGILFDRPPVVAGVAPDPRMSVQGGDFFKDPLPTADAYILSRVLHDWADQEAAAILRSVRRCAPKHAELLVLESILPEGPEPHHAKVLDIIMLTISGGRERTRREYQTLFEAGGFRMDRVVPTAGPVSVILGAPS
jgi:O-methyltransferase